LVFKERRAEPFSTLPGPSHYYINFSSARMARFFAMVGGVSRAYQFGERIIAADALRLLLRRLLAVAGKDDLVVSSRLFLMAP
jgi:hypothetical protein